MKHVHTRWIAVAELFGLRPEDQEGCSISRKGQEIRSAVNERLTVQDRTCWTNPGTATTASPGQFHSEKPRQSGYFTLQVPWQTSCFRLGPRVIATDFEYCLAAGAQPTPPESVNHSRSHPAVTLLPMPREKSVNSSKPNGKQKPPHEPGRQPVPRLYSD
jgi:hypothetical protein